ncbi:MAG: 2-oxo acid dehydrogenase subunit E2 [Phycisphaeraceae bacterium]|nr:2-oxo acid dehydrogenase subunit E2 [Phycisphaeraceae bacterium]
MAGKTSTDPNVFILPDLGEGVHEAELIRWLVKPGDRVEEHQTVAEMETDKALVEVPSPRDGVIKTLNGEVGEIMKVGAIAWTYEGASSAAPEPKPQSQTARGVSTTKTVERQGAVVEHANEGEREDAGTVVGSLSEMPGLTAAAGKALATPAVRRVARDLGVDIDTVPGSGIGGRVTEKDVRAFAEHSSSKPGRNGSAPHAAPSRRDDHEVIERAPAPAPRRESHSTPALAVNVPERPRPAAPSAPGELVRIPIRGVRKTIAARLRESVNTAVHFNVMDEADITSLDAVRKRTAASSGEKISFLPFVASAVCKALQAYPSLNATVDDDAGEVLRHRAVHLGIAADTDHGLTVPVMFDADRMGVLQIGREIDNLARMTRDRSIPRDLLMGSTFTISNVGSYAGRFATPIINYPEVAILGVGRARDAVLVKDGMLKIAKVMPLSLAADHRVVDGAEAARFLQHVIDLLQAPENLLAPARG